VQVLTGAGVSVSCGIPDFRTPGTGLYSNLSQYKLTSPEQMFSLAQFHSDPRPFFHLSRSIYPGHFIPSPSHYFVRLLAEKGLLRRLYTQNIDTLDRIAGVAPEKIVEAHGSYATATCTACARQYSAKWLEAKLFGPGGCKAPTSQAINSEGPRLDVFDPSEIVVPTCDACVTGVVKPDITFFGEQASHRKLRAGLWRLASSLSAFMCARSCTSSCPQGTTSS
jgi:NAD-dependent SIR2 family protein deacetylase